LREAGGLGGHKKSFLYPFRRVALLTIFFAAKRNGFFELAWESTKENLDFARSATVRRNSEGT
jgi:hypothetical protein